MGVRAGMDSNSLKFYIIADEEMLNRSDHESLEVFISSLLQGGATTIQLRCKHASAREQEDLLGRIRFRFASSTTLFIVNDRMDVALTAGAHGVHLGSDDLSLTAARRIAPSGFLIGSSVDTPEEARQAESEGADYLGAGPVYPTQTKKTTNPAMGTKGLEEIVQAVSIPVVGIGGIGPENISEVLGVGAAGAAVVSSVVSSVNPEVAVRLLREAVDVN